MSPKPTLDAAARAALGGTYLDLSDGVTHYSLQGPDDGQVVVLLHGGTIPHWTWSHQVPALVRAGFRVLSYDMFGRGLSDRPWTRYDRDLFSRQLTDLISGLELTEPVDLVGTSLGGAIATLTAARHPERVRRLGLISPVVQSVEIFLISMLKWPSIAGFGVGELLVQSVVMPRLRKRVQTFFDLTETPDEFADLFERQIKYEGFERALLSMIRCGTIGDYLEAYQKVGELGLPSLLIWGTEDTEISPEAIAHGRSALNGPEYHEFVGAGHGAMIEHPDRINGIIIEFLSRSS